ncbi:MAG: BON domain-containing protein [Pseudomonadota bacterium]
MNRKIITLMIGALALGGMLQGCVAVVAGGAATGAAVAHDRRSAGTVLDDQTIEVKAIAAILSDKELSNSAHINVTSYNYAVLLTGEAPSEELRKRAEELVRKIEKVKNVHNEITIAAPSSMVSRSSDTVLTGKVKANMVGLEGLDPTRVKVVTENGVVYLMGLVTRAEADIAANAASKTTGVQRVVKIFEYIG